MSATGQLDGYGLDTQRADVQAWADHNGRTIIGWHYDLGVTGSLEAEARDGFMAALLQLRDNREAGAIIAPRLDRFARLLVVQESILGMVWRMGCDVITADVGVVPRDDPDDPMRTAMRQMIGVMAQLDRAMTIRRLRVGRQIKASEGRKAVGAYAYGTRGEGSGRHRDAVLNPAEEKTLRRLVELRADGLSYRQVCEVLDIEQRRPRKAQQWHPETVRRIYLRETTT